MMDNEEKENVERIEELPEIDAAHGQTDKELEKMIRHIYGIYNTAKFQLEQKWENYLKKTGQLIKEYQDAYEAAKKSGNKDDIKKTGYKLSQVKREKTFGDRRFRELTEIAAQNISHVNEISMAYINDQLPEIYAINYNQMKDKVDNMISFSLVDADTVKNLALHDDSLLPQRKINVPNDVEWNVKSINAEVLQGIIQGESMDDIAKRLEIVTDMNAKSAIRNARTMVTGAECKGRQDSYIRAEEMGIMIEKQWLAASDNITREAHRELNGKSVKPEKPFHSDVLNDDIMFPGDPHAKPENVYNCRCTLTANIIGFRGKKI